MRNQAVIIPALNPTENLIFYVKELLLNGFAEIIVVNDGSKSEAEWIFDELSNLEKCTVLIHKNNKGKGRALKTAFAYCVKRLHRLDGVITADADGQHAVIDVCNVSNHLSTHPTSLTLGVRNFKEANVPPRSYLGNTITSAIFYTLFRLKLKDTQTGLRAIPMNELSDLLLLKGERYEYEINMLIYVKKRKLSIEEVTIQTIYHDNNAGSYFNAVNDSLKILNRIIIGFFNFNGQCKKQIKHTKSNFGEINE